METSCTTQTGLALARWSSSEIICMRVCMANSSVLTNYCPCNKLWNKMLQWCACAIMSSVNPYQFFNQLFILQWWSGVWIPSGIGILVHAIATGRNAYSQKCLWWLCLNSLSRDSWLSCWLHEEFLALVNVQTQRKAGLSMEQSSIVENILGSQNVHKCLLYFFE